MFAFILQTLLLIAIAFILGCICGCLLRRILVGDDEAAPARTVTTGTAATAAAAAAAVAVAARPQEPATPAKPAAAPVRLPDPEPVAFSAAPEAKPVAPLMAAPKAKASAAAKPKAKAKAPAAKPKAKAAPKPAAKAKPVKVAASTGPDDLKLIRGIGRKNEGQLNAVGVTRFAQIAAWTSKDEQTWGEKLDFPGRIEREEWVSQAKKLASGTSTYFSRRVKSGKVETSLGKAAAGKPASRSAPTARTAASKPKAAAPAKKLAAPRRGKPDNLTLINGIGNAIEKKLNSLGVFHFDQIASWSAADATKFSNEVGFPGRVQRENWIGEARTFAAGGTTEHARKVERGEIATSRKSTAAEKKK